MSHDVFIALAVGNTRARWGLFRGLELDESSVAPSADAQTIAKAVIALAGDAHEAVVVMSSVNQPAANAIANLIEQAGNVRVARIGLDVAIPLTHTLDDATTLGQDRALCALAAHRQGRSRSIAQTA